jgi:hypothetical protein
MALPHGRRVLTPAEKKLYAELHTPLQSEAYYRQLRELRGPDASVRQPSVVDELSGLPDPRLLPPPVDPWKLLPMSTTVSLPSSRVSRSRIRTFGRTSRQAPSLVRAPHYSSLPGLAPASSQQPSFTHGASMIPATPSAPQQLLPVYLDSMMPSTVQPSGSIYDQHLASGSAPPISMPQYGSTPMTLASTPQHAAIGSEAPRPNLHIFLSNLNQETNHCVC